VGASFVVISGDADRPGLLEEQLKDFKDDLCHWDRYDPEPCHQIAKCSDWKCDQDWEKKESSLASLDAEFLDESVRRFVPYTNNQIKYGTIGRSAQPDRKVIEASSPTRTFSITNFPKGHRKYLHNFQHSRPYDFPMTVAKRRPEASKKMRASHQPKRGTHR
jgi:hypothetical protein